MLWFLEPFFVHNLCLILTILFFVSGVITVVISIKEKRLGILDTLGMGIGLIFLSSFTFIFAFTSSQAV